MPRLANFQFKKLENEHLSLIKKSVNIDINYPILAELGRAGEEKEREREDGRRGLVSNSLRGAFPRFVSG